METIKMKFVNYAQFRDMEVPLRGVTVFTGDNGVGLREAWQGLTHWAHGECDQGDWRDSDVRLVNPERGSTYVSVGTAKSEIVPVDGYTGHKVVNFEPTGPFPFKEIIWSESLVGEDGPVISLVNESLATRDHSRELFVVLWPENGLSERYQYLMGQRIARCASVIRTLVVTYSSHIIQGVVKACVGGQLGLSCEDAGFVYFFKDASDPPMTSSVELRVDSHGTFSDYPEGFLDQTTLELLEDWRWPNAAGERK